MRKKSGTLLLLRGQVSIQKQPMAITISRIIRSVPSRGDASTVLVVLILHRNALSGHNCCHDGSIDPLIVENSS